MYRRIRASPRKGSAVVPCLAENRVSLPGTLSQECRSLRGSTHCGLQCPEPLVMRLRADPRRWAPSISTSRANGLKPGGRRNNGAVSAMLACATRLAKSQHERPTQDAHPY